MVERVVPNALKDWRTRHALCGWVAPPPWWAYIVRAVIAVLSPAFAHAQLTSHAVQLSATIQAAPAQIRLGWPADALVTVNTYTVMRRDSPTSGWTTLANLVGSDTSYADTNVRVGRVYEYQVVKRAATLTGYGYVAAGIDVPAIEGRGKLVLVVERDVGAALSGEIDRLVTDLTGDGWVVARHDVGRGDAPSSVRVLIRGEHLADPANVRALLLLGRVPIARSGSLNVDGHGGRPLPADVFYGDVDGNWTDANGDGGFEQDTIPSDAELMVGRVDFADLGVAGGDEIALLRRYLQKAHDYRHARTRVTPRALLGDRFGDFGGEAFAASAVRNFTALLGPGRIEVASAQDGASAAQRWISRLSAQDYQWAFAAGGGSDTTIGWMGTFGQFADVRSADLLRPGARGTFYLLFGSWFVDWSKPDNVMRAALAAPTHGLAAAWTGRPHLFFHHMAVGEPIGYGIRLSQNNNSTYANQVNRHARGVHVALLGDPTLRLQVVAPPGAVQAGSGTGAPALSWGASPDATHGYHVFRATNPRGPYTRVTTTPVNATSFTDASAPAGEFTYQVRALKREVSGSATYFNLSQGVFASATVTAPSSPGTPPPDPPAPSPVQPPPNPVAPPVGGSGSGSGGGGGGGGAPSMWFLAALAASAAVRYRNRAGGRLKSRASALLPGRLSSRPDTAASRRFPSPRGRLRAARRLRPSGR